MQHLIRSFPILLMLCVGVVATVGAQTVRRQLHSDFRMQAAAKDYLNKFDRRYDPSRRGRVQPFMADGNWQKCTNQLGALLVAMGNNRGEASALFTKAAAGASINTNRLLQLNIFYTNQTVAVSNLLNSCHALEAEYELRAMRSTNGAR